MNILRVLSFRRFFATETSTLKKGIIEFHFAEKVINSDRTENDYPNIIHPGPPPHKQTSKTFLVPILPTSAFFFPFLEQEIVVV